MFQLWFPFFGLLGHVSAQQLQPFQLLVPSNWHYNYHILSYLGPAATTTSGPIAGARIVSIPLEGAIGTAAREVSTILVGATEAEE